MLVPTRQNSFLQTRWCLARRTALSFSVDPLLDGLRCDPTMEMVRGDPNLHSLLQIVREHTLVFFDLFGCSVGMLRI